jgi:hypothetical protein
MRATQGGGWDGILPSPRSGRETRARNASNSSSSSSRLLAWSFTNHVQIGNAVSHCRREDICRDRVEKSATAALCDKWDKHQPALITYETARQKICRPPPGGSGGKTRREFFRALSCQPARRFGRGNGLCFIWLIISACRVGRTQQQRGLSVRLEGFRKYDQDP